MLIKYFTLNFAEVWFCLIRMSISVLPWVVLGHVWLLKMKLITENCFILFRKMLLYKKAVLMFNWYILHFIKNYIHSHFQTVTKLQFLVIRFCYSINYISIPQFLIFISPTLGKQMRQKLINILLLCCFDAYIINCIGCKLKIEHFVGVQLCLKRVS